MEGAAVVRGLQTILMKRERGAVRGGGAKWGSRQEVRRESIQIQRRN